MKIKKKKSNLFIPLICSLAVHSILLMLFAAIYFENSFEENTETIQLEYKTIVKHMPEKKIVEKPKLSRIERTPSSPNIVSEIPEAQDTLPIAASSMKQDSSQEVSLSDLTAKLNKLDSLIMNNPSLMGLKYAMTEKIKTETIVETDSAFIVRRLKESLIKYYKDKYPTPLSKFGDGNPGIAIDKIIDLFSSDDIDEKKIKEYLNIK